jgi:hypothetical protein
VVIVLRTSLRLPLPPRPWAITSLSRRATFFFSFSFMLLGILLMGTSRSSPPLSSLSSSQITPTTFNFETLRVKRGANQPCGKASACPERGCGPMRFKHHIPYVRELPSLPMIGIFMEPSALYLQRSATLPRTPVPCVVRMTPDITCCAAVNTPLYILFVRPPLYGSRLLSPRSRLTPMPMCAPQPTGPFSTLTPSSIPT